MESIAKDRRDLPAGTVGSRSNTGRKEHKMKYKLAESQGAYIDRLRTKYPFRIKCHGYEATLYGVQPLVDGQDMPIYRFPGGTRVVDPADIKDIIEW